VKLTTHSHPVAYSGRGLRGSTPLSPEIPKALQNRAKLNPIVKTVKGVEFRTPKPQNFRKKTAKF